MPHIHEKIDFTVEVFIVRDGKVLLRKHDKYGIWLSVGGHIELDEDPVQAALREVKEEVGLEVKLRAPEDFPPLNSPEYSELITPVFLNRHRISPTHEHVTLTYFATAGPGEISQPEKEKSPELRWFSLAELEDQKNGVGERVRLYAKKALLTCA
jgi:8-oxo-dGTP pyrophosphatase MutT (NUDIX family)